MVIIKSYNPHKENLFGVLNFKSVKGPKPLRTACLDVALLVTSSTIGPQHLRHALCDPMNSGECPFPLGFKWRLFWEMSEWEAHTSFVHYSGNVVTALWCWSTVPFPEPQWWVCAANHNVQISGRSYGACILSPVGSTTTLCTRTHKHTVKRGNIPQNRTTRDQKRPCNISQVLWPQKVTATFQKEFIVFRGFLDFKIADRRSWTVFQLILFLPN